MLKGTCVLVLVARAKRDGLLRDPRYVGRSGATSDSDRESAQRNSRLSRLGGEDTYICYMLWLENRKHLYIFQSHGVWEKHEVARVLGGVVPPFRWCLLLFHMSSVTSRIPPVSLQNMHQHIQFVPAEV